MENKVIKEKSCVYVVPRGNIFNRAGFPLFESFTEEYSWQLFNALYLNFFEIFKDNGTYKITYVLHENDREFIPESLSDHKESFFFTDTLEFADVMEKLKQKCFSGYSSNMIIFAETIGITAKMVDAAFNLLNNEDNYLVAGKTTNGYLNFFGFNSYQDCMAQLNYKLAENFDDMLKKLCVVNASLHVFDGGLIIKSLQDFKTLYKILSSKESFAYCNQQIHELFTNVFIEYKDLL